MDALRFFFCSTVNLVKSDFGLQFHENRVIMKLTRKRRREYDRSG